jgi:hypothetical protein
MIGMVVLEAMIWAVVDTSADVLLMVVIIDAVVTVPFTEVIIPEVVFAILTLMPVVAAAAVFLFVGTALFTLTCAIDGVVSENIDLDQTWMIDIVMEIYGKVVVDIVKLSTLQCSIMTDASF